MDISPGQRQAGPGPSPREHRCAAETGLARSQANTSGQPLEQQPWLSEDQADTHLMCWTKPFFCPELGHHRAQHSSCILFCTQLSSQTSDSSLEISLSVKEIPKTTFLYNHTFCFTSLCSCSTCADALTLHPLGTHPPTPGCVELSCAFPSVNTEQATAKRKGELLSGHGESTDLPPKDTKPPWWSQVGEAPGAAKSLTSSVKLLHYAGQVMGGLGCYQLFTEQPELFLYTHLSSGKAYLDSRGCRMWIPHCPVAHALVNHDALHNPEKNKGFECSPDQMQTSFLSHRLLWKLSKCFCFFFSWCKDAPRNIMLEVSSK